MFKKLSLNITLIFIGLLLFSQQNPDTLYQKGEQLFHTGDYCNAASFFQQALEAGEKSNFSTDSKALAGYNSGLGYFACQNYINAQKMFEASVKYFLELSDTLNTAKIYEYIGECNYLNNNTEKAIESYKQALSYYKSTNYPNRAFVYKRLGDVFFSKEKNQISKLFYDSALVYSTGASNKIMADLLYAIGEVMYKTENIDTANHYFSLSCNKYSEDNNYAGIANCNFKKAKIAKITGDYMQALDLFNKTIYVFKRMNHKSGIAIVNNNIGLIYLENSLYNEAQVLFKEALKYVDKSTEEYVNTLNNLSRVFFYRAEFDSALNFQYNAVASMKTVKNCFVKAGVFNNLAGIYSGLGVKDSTLKYLQKASDLYKQCGDKIETAKIYNNIGGLFDSKKSYLKANEYYQKAFDLYKERNKKAQQATVLNNMAGVLVKMNQPETAMEKYNLALSIFNEIGDNREQAYVLNNIGALFLSQNNYKEALECLNLSKAVRMGSGDYIGLINTELNIGNVFLESKQPQKAIAAYKNAESTLLNVMKNAPEELKMQLLDAKYKVYESLMSAYYDTGKKDSVFYYAEKSKTKTFFNNKQVNIREIIKQKQAVLLNNEMLVEYIFTGRESLLIISATSNNVEVHKVDLKKYLSEIIKNNLVRTQLLKENSVERINYIEKTLNNNDLSLFTEEGILDAVKALLTSYRNILLQENYNYYAEIELSKLLFKFLIEPISINKEIQRLIIVPDLFLNLIPFEVLRNKEGNYLIENYSISYAHSFSLLHFLRIKENRNYENELLSLGLSSYEDIQKCNKMVVNNIETLHLLHKNSGKECNIYGAMGYQKFNNLPASKNEIELIKLEYPKGKYFFNKEATEYRIKQMNTSGELKNYKYIHFSTHGISVEKVPQLSALVLNPGNGENGFLSAEEIVNLDINASLVSLSACETNKGEIYRGEGNINLVYAFHRAGAAGVISSLWQIDDKASAFFFSEVYRLLKEGNTVSIAVSKVKRNFIQGKYTLYRSNPYFWSAFLYHGK